ncbi:rod shape-determining protein RodA [bacterium]|jgi:rod shape determining protein RodA|nr:rod shape-determining protein RodA [Flavobacteriaceae bacterium]MDA9642751.1 rod shape-determining protein RodA [bacterium]
MNKKIFFRLDWLSILLYLLLVSFGLVNIYSSSFSNTTILFWDLDSLVGKQFWIFIACLVILPLVLAVKSNFFEHLTYIFYGISIFSLLGLFIFGQTISGATSWYSLGSFSLQPSEFAKITTAMVVALNLSSFQNDLKKNTHLLKIILFVSLPMFLIILQPDAGSALVFMGIFFVLIREGLNLKFLFLAMGLSLIFIFTLLFSPLNLSLVMGFIFFIIYNLIKRRYPKTKKSPFFLTLIIGILFSFSVSFIFNTIFEQRHRDRFNIILGLETDSRGIGYNINQSKIAIGSGGFSGKGFLNGSQTKGNFVPEQETDYIFSIVGEEWGFLGSVTLILLFVILIFRIIHKAERHTSSYARIFSYTFASMLFVHFFVNIGMTLGLVPTVGIPLPFISYGGSNLLAFSLMLFIYLNFDANRLDY